MSREYLATDRVVLLKFTRNGEARRGSGLRVGGAYVLTADHCADGDGHVVTVGGHEYPATVAQRSGDHDVDIAMLSVPDLPQLAWLSCARLNSSVATKLEDCVALGFPLWNRRTGTDYRAQADGYVGTGEGSDALLAFKITTPAIKDKELAAGDLSSPTSPWGGMSGAVIVAPGPHVIGVVRGHALAAGVGSLTFTPLTAIDLLPRQDAERLWDSLGVVDAAALRVLPVPDATDSKAIVVGEIPRQPHAFVQRETEIRVAEALEQSGVAVVCALTGLRGVGKTQLAAAYARSRVFAGDGLVGWVNAESRDDLLAGMARIARRLGVSDPDGDSVESAHRLREHLQIRRGAGLVVFDNAVDPEALLEFLPAMGSTRIVITSTDRSFAEFGAEVDVAVYARAESVAYLRLRTESDDDVAAAAVAEELGDLPVALAQAAATIRSQRLTYRSYLERLASVPVIDLLGPAAGQGYPRATAAALLLSIESTEKRDSQGVTGLLLRSVAVLSPEGVHRDILARLPLPVPLAEKSLDAALEMCVRGSLLGWSIGTESVMIHRLVGRVLRERDRASGHWAGTVATTLEMLEMQLFDESWAWGLRDRGSELVSHLEALWEATPTEQPLDLPLLARELAARSWGVRQLRAAADLKRALELGLRVMSDCEQVLGSDHPNTLTARDILAGVYQSLGRLAQAAVLLEQTLADRERVLGSDHPETLASRDSLGRVYQSAGRLAESIPLLERTVADRERVLGSDHPETLDSRNNLAVAYQSVGQLAQAVPLLERTLADHERVLGADHPGTLSSRDSLALVYRSGGRLAEAIRIYEAVLADRERVLASDHPDTLASRDSLAGAYRASTRYVEAIRLYEEVLADRERLLGTDHPQTLSTRNDLAVAYDQAGRHADAVPLLERTLADHERVVGADHPDTHNLRVNLACTYRNVGRMREAISLHEQAFAEQGRMLGADHPATLSSLVSLAVTYEVDGRIAQSIRLLRTAVANQQRVLGPEHPATLASLNNLAVVYHAANQLNEAIPLLEHNVAVKDQILGAVHPDTLISRRNLALAYRSDGRNDDAISLFENVLADRQRVLGIDHPSTLMSRIDLARGYWSKGRLTDATALFERALAELEKEFGAEHVVTLSTREQLAESYRRGGRVAAAYTLFNQVLADRERLFGVDHKDTMAVRDRLAHAQWLDGRVAEALVLYERLLADREQWFGSDHLDTMTSRENLAHAYRGASRLVKAIPVYERVLADCRRVLGVGHAKTNSSRRHLATAYWLSGRHADATMLYQPPLRLGSSMRPDPETARQSVNADSIDPASQEPGKQTIDVEDFRANERGAESRQRTRSIREAIRRWIGF